MASAPLPRARWGRHAVRWVARSVVGEAGWNADREWAAIAGVYVTRALERDQTVVHVARAYSAAIRPHARHRRPWLLEMDEDAREPASWPPGPSWARHRLRWLAALDVVRGVLEGRIASPCPPGTREFGGPMDSAPRGHVAVDCGATRNTFYARDPG